MEKKKGNFDNIKKYCFKPGQSGNPKGRPKSKVPEFLSKVMTRSKAKKFSSLSNVEVDDWERALLTLTMKQIQEIAKQDDMPAYPRGLAVAILYDEKNGNTKTIDKLRERQYGTPIQKLELTGADGSDLLQRPVSPDEAKAMLADLENNC